jgi:DNA-binding XRE family transcriptional regulator
LRSNLRKARLKKDLSKKDLAALVGISERMYNYIESGESDGSLTVWQKLSSVLDDSIDNLIVKEEEIDVK